LDDVHLGPQDPVLLLLQRRFGLFQSGLQFVLFDLFGSHERIRIPENRTYLIPEKL
jgi:hypothetical protein